MKSYLRPAALTLLVAWVAVVAYLTLTPAGYRPASSAGGFLCMWCGDFDGSDIFRNWVLFVPGGLLAALVLGRRMGLLLPIALTFVVELAQVWIPGRDSALQDLLFNGLGGVTGVALATFGLRDWGQRAVILAAAAFWLAPLALLVPQTTSYDLWGQWTPRFRGTADYRGEVLDARVGGLSVPSRRYRDKPALDAMIVEREPIELRLEVGPRPSSFAPIFQIMDREQQGVVELGALRGDLILRGRNPTKALKLDQPDARWPDAMDGLSPGDTVNLVVDRGRGSVCMAIDGRERCNLAPSLADGWGHVLNLEGPPLWFRQLMSVAWAMGLGGLIGLCSRSWRSGLAFTAALAVVGYVASVVSPDVRPSVVHATVLVAGALIGIFLRDPVIALWKELRPT